MMPFYWYPEEGAIIGGELVRADIIANSLQLAAKLHEILIIMSLSAITLSIFRRRLVSGGIRLGFLTGGYRVGDWAYLCRSAFRQQSLDRSRPWELLLSGFLVFATIMSTLAGPASAVLLVPTLGWYGFNGKTTFENITLPLMYYNTSHEVWTTHLGDYADWYIPCNLMDKTMMDSSYCPGSGYSELIDWAGTMGATDLANNLTFQSTSTEIRRYLNITQRGDTTLSTTPPHFVMNSIGLFQQFIDSTYVGAVSTEPRYRLKSQGYSQYQPFVQSVCETYSYGASDANPVFTYPVDLDCLGDADCEHIKSNPPSSAGFWPSATYQDSSGFSMEYSTHCDNSSIVFVSGVVPNLEEDEIYLCTLLASWVPSKFTYDPRVDDMLQATPSASDNLQEAYDNKFDDKARVIKFDRNWFPLSNPVLNSSDDYWSNTTVGRVMQQLTFNDTKNNTSTDYMGSLVQSDTATKISLARVFGAYLTESLSRLSFGTGPWVRLTQTRDELSAFDLTNQHGSVSGIETVDRWNATHQRFRFQGGTWYNNQSFDDFVVKFDRALKIGIQAERYGYGSGQRRRTLDFAVAMMCIYLGTVLVYGLVIGVLSVLESLHVRLWGGPVRVLSVVSWSDLQDLVLLALRTPSPRDPDLADVGAGVTSDQVWKKTVKVRADDGDSVQLVLGDSDGMNELETTGGKKYY
ncbi:hypothetical protein KJ359_011940 [Pestalotiopsis sp. 9143b]|nr:hypothetical protein KJ359_011940 [Pestalotiopsis sp. 9143b]